VLEASKLGIPIVGIVDTNNSPDHIDYIVPGNDDSMRAIKLYTKMVADAILVGKESIVADLNSKDEMVELEDEESSPTRVPVKISAKKSAVAAASKAAKPVETIKPAPEAVVAEEAVAKAAESEDAVTEEAVTEEVAAELEVASVETAEPKKAAAKKAAPKKAATKKAAPKKTAPKKAATIKAASKKTAPGKAASD
ncbi:MAG: 30S ribosomal protein S2, partial [Gammaproteobacteria bacterium]|nr:30S ribosomal protein S2 [Gammaproteobacteria bacterium]